MDTPDVIEPLSVEQAAARLGRSTMRVHDMIKEGKLRPVARNPVKLMAADIEQLRQARHDAAVEELTARGVDLVKLARDVRRQIRPLPMDPFSGGVKGVTSLPRKVRDLFGPAALMALTLQDRDECCWCAARVAAGMFKVPPPKYGTVMLALLGDPCATDMRRFAGAEFEKLRARVHPGAGAPPAARTGPASTAGSTAVSKPVVRAAERVQDDGGKALVGRRLREARARLKDAKRRGDQSYALRLARTVRDLERDAARVDGRAVTASARPGTLRCGHPLAQNCACPRRASRRSAR